ncbi:MULTISPECIES: zinc-dependent alcohol dehydrogenase family protein [Halomicrobium]|uniref:Alcohol dehydrogenase GroES domain protein n=2 Tax=Halomicrobium mukohataei TaxID=57705 RepID=C7NY88_HALMD|nr:MULTISPECIES: zinc-dependent alcohol dehydrogenase family protein [Halomicrobium]ACV48548.1 Alcohol dehydrogenase GroES domain protein [Halomicrobium mukohataei DSM 12286]QCD66947.1 IMP dehydrogenase [Halomicrobium mukohataei]QFR21757.1 alcohol dehydrogenase catalytic domain-containing protein [Halomicrobium sp. ZPS1]
MRAAIYDGPGEISVEEVPRPEIEDPGDAIVRVTHTAVCGSDLWFYRGESDREAGSRVGHEPMGVVEAVGDDVDSVRPGDHVFAPFVVSCGYCEYCRRGLHTSCVNGDSWGGDNGGAQGEYVRSPHADGTLVRVPDRYADDEDVLESVLPLTDVMGTGHHAAVSAGVGAGDTCVVVGDGAVGLCGVLAARRLGASRIVAVGHHPDRLALAAEFGATETVLGGDGTDVVDRVRELTYGGAEHVLECVGAASAMEQAVEVCRPGGTVGYVGVPHGVDDAGVPIFDMFGDNIALRGGVAPVRAYADDLLEDVLGGTLDPSPIFTKTVSLEEIAAGYRAMDERDAIKVLVEP